MDEKEQIAALAKQKGYPVDGSLVKDLSFYKKEVNLVALAVVRYGYTINGKKTGRGLEGHHRFVVLDGERSSLNLGHADARKGEKSFDGDFSQRVSERLMISKNQVGMFQFSSVNNTNPYSKGSVFDFLMYHNPSFQFRDCIKELNQFLLSPEANADLSLSFENARISNEDRDKAITSFNNITKLNDASFLEKRGLSRDTIFSSEFSSSIYNATHTNRETGKTYVNIAFPMVSEKCITGYEMATDMATGFDVRNTGIKSTINDKGSSLWKSYFDVNKTVPQVVFTESPIDAMSYHELNAQQGKNNLYLSSCGHLQDSQISLMVKFFAHENPRIKEAFKSASLVIGADKDLAGGFFTNKLLGQFDPKLLGSGKAPSLNAAFGTKRDVEKAVSLLQNASFYPTMVPEQNYAKVCISCPCQGENSSKFLSDYLKNAFNVLNSKHAYAYSENQPFALLSNAVAKDSVRFEVGFRNDKNQWGVVNSFLLEHKYGASARISIAQPVLKDYNEDLMAAKKLNDLTDRFVKREGEKYPIFNTKESKRVSDVSVSNDTTRGLKGSNGSRLKL